MTIKKIKRIMYNEKINATSVAGENKNTGINTNVKVMIKNEVKIGTEVKKVAFVAENRSIDKNNVKKKIESFKKFGRNIVPLLYVNAADVENSNLIDAITKKTIEPKDYVNYIAALDGQHRYIAATELENSEDANGFTTDNLIWAKIEIPQGMSFVDVLVEVNNVTSKWKGADYIYGCVLKNPDDKSLFASRLNKLGVSAKTVNKYLFFSEKAQWARIMASKTDEEREKYYANADLERAKAIWTVVETFPDNVQTSSVIIDYIKDNGGVNHWNEELVSVSKLTDKQKAELVGLKNKKLTDKFLEIMKSVA
jgi:hypothetical protein